MSETEIGTVKFFDEARGFGFIRRDGGEGDVFIHIKSLKMSGMETLKAGDRVEYDRVKDNRGFQAYRPRLLDPVRP